jgi:hypothetical protein
LRKLRHLPYVLIALHAVFMAPTADTDEIWNNPSALPHGGVMYGNPLGGYATGNMSKVLHSASVRFRAEQTGSLAQLRWHNRYLDQATIDSRCKSPSDVWCTCKNNNLDEYLCGYTTGNMYSVGNGGLTELTIRADDGTSNHAPTATVLAKIVVPVSMQGGFRNSNAFVPLLTPTYVTFNLDRNVWVQAGKTYHIVMQNLRPPTTCPRGGGYSVSEAKRCDRDRGAQGLNGIHTGGPTPTLSAGPYHGFMTLRKDAAAASWKPHGGSVVAPWYALVYTDGQAFGNGYTFDQSRKYLGHIGGGKKVRQRFIVMDAARFVDGFWLRAGRNGPTSMGNLTGTLSGGGVNVSASVPASSVSQSRDLTESVIEWVYFRLPRQVLLTKGVEYNLTLSANSPADYIVNTSVPFGIMKSRNDWNNAVAEYTTGGSWNRLRSDQQGREADLSLVFTVAGKPKTVGF